MRHSGSDGETEPHSRSPFSELIAGEARPKSSNNPLRLRIVLKPTAGESLYACLCGGDKHALMWHLICQSRNRRLATAHVEADHEVLFKQSSGQLPSVHAAALPEPWWLEK